MLAGGEFKSTNGVVSENHTPMPQKVSSENLCSPHKSQGLQLSGVHGQVANEMQMQLDVPFHQLAVVLTQHRVLLH